MEDPLLYATAADADLGATSTSFEPKKALDACDKRLQSACDETESKLLDALFPLIEDLEDAEQKAFQVGIRNAIHWTRRAASDAARDLQNEHVAGTRTALKAQERSFQQKLETARNAAKMSMENQAKTMEASHQRRLSLSLEEAQGPGDAALQFANAEIDKLNAKLKGMQIAGKAAEEGLLAAERRWHDTSVELEQTRSERDALDSAAAAAQAELTDVMRDLQISRNEKQTIAQQVRNLKRAYQECREERDDLFVEAGDMRRQRDEARDELDQLRAEIDASGASGASASHELVRLRGVHSGTLGERDALKVELAEAKQALEAAEAAAEAAASRAAERHATELGEAERYTAELEERLKGEAQSESQLLMEAADARLQRARSDLEEEGRAKSSLQAAYTALEEDVRRQAIAFDAERDALALRFASSEAAWQARLRAMEEDAASKAAALKAAMRAAGNGKDDDGSALVEAHGLIERLKRDLAKTSAALDDAKALAHAQAEAREDATTRLEVAEDELEATAAERDSLATKAAELQKRVTANEGLSEMLQVSQEQCEQLEARGGVLDEQVNSLEKQLHKATVHAADHERRKAEWSRALDNQKGLSARLGKELQETRASLEEALSSVGSLTTDRSKLVDQVHELVRRYRVASAALVRTTSELRHSAVAIKQAGEEYERMTTLKDTQLRHVQENSAVERAKLVQAALQSLTQLRSHLTATLSGLHVAPADESEANEAATYQQWRARWGVVAPNNEAALVRLMPPETPPLSVKPLSSRPSTAGTLASRPSAAAASYAARSRGVPPGVLVPPEYAAAAAAAAAAAPGGAAAPAGAIVPVAFEAPHFYTNPQVAYQRPSSAMPSVVSWKKVAEPPGTRPSAAVASVRAARASSASPRTPRPMARREYLRY